MSHYDTRREETCHTMARDGRKRVLMMIWALGRRNKAVIWRPWRKRVTQWHETEARRYTGRQVKLKHNNAKTKRFFVQFLYTNRSLGRGEKGTRASEYD